MRKVVENLNLYGFMDSENIREKIKKKIEEKGLSVSGVERSAKIGSSVLRYFLNGKIKNLKKKNIISLAEVLEINHNELMDQEKWEEDYFESIFICFKKILKEHNITISSAGAFSLLEDFYNINYKNRPSDMFKSLSEWLVKELLKKL